MKSKNKRRGGPSPCFQILIEGLEEDGGEEEKGEKGEEAEEAEAEEAEEGEGGTWNWGAFF